MVGATDGSFMMDEMRHGSKGIMYTISYCIIVHVPADDYIETLSQLHH